MFPVGRAEECSGKQPPPLLSIYLSLSHTHTHTLSLSLSLLHTHTHTHTPVAFAHDAFPVELASSPAAFVPVSARPRHHSCLKEVIDSGLVGRKVFFNHHIRLVSRGEKMSLQGYLADEKQCPPRTLQ